MTKKKPKSEHKKELMKIERKNGRPTKHEVRYKDAGRPPAITQDKVNQFKTAFGNGLTIDQACIFANISKQTYYNHGKKNLTFFDEMDAVRKRVDIQAKVNVVKLIKDGSYEASKFWLSTKCKDEFSLRTETTGKDGQELNYTSIKIVDGKETIELK